MLDHDLNVMTVKLNHLTDEKVLKVQVKEMEKAYNLFNCHFN